MENIINGKGFLIFLIIFLLFLELKQETIIIQTSFYAKCFNVYDDNQSLCTMNQKKTLNLEVVSSG